MGAPTEKVYVAIGNDLQDGRKTLEWTIRKWMSHPISIVILHVTNDISVEFVYTPCKFTQFNYSSFLYVFWIGF